MNTKIRILIADDHPIVRQGLVELLDRQKDMSVVGEASNGEEVCQLYDQLSPDVLLLDLRMPKKDGLEVIKDLMSRTPKSRIIVMTTYQATEGIRLALTAGAKGYLLKEAEPPQLWDTVRKVFAGDLVLPPSVAGKLAGCLAQEELSRREMQVLRRLCAGDSNKEIAQKIYLSESSVKFYTKSLYKKLGADGRTAAVAIAARRGLVRIDLGTLRPTARVQGPPPDRVPHALRQPEAGELTGHARRTLPGVKTRPVPDHDMGNF